MHDCDNNSLCDLAKTRFREMDLRLTQRIDGVEKAIAKWEKQSDERMHEANQFRRQILDERYMYVTRREVYLMLGVVMAIVTALIAYMRLG